MTGPTCQRHGREMCLRGNGQGRFVWTCYTCRTERKRERRQSRRVFHGYEGMAIGEFNRRIERGIHSVRQALAARVHRYSADEVAELNRRLGLA